MASPAGRAALWAALGATLAALAAVGAAAWRGVARPPPRELTPPEVRVALWRSAGLSPGGTVDAHLAAGREALAADLPARDEEARGHFAEALALDPSRLDALAAWLAAWAAAAGDDPDGDELREAHRLATWARERQPGRPDLQVAWARLLLLVPGERNAAEALAAARKAVEAGGGAEAFLGLGEASLAAGDPAAAADAARKALAAAPSDRRPLLLAARARWRGGDARSALDLLERRLALDPIQPVALALEARIQVAVGRVEAARKTLRRWTAAAPRAPEPALLAAMVAYQIEGDPAEARRLLARAREGAAEDFQLARILAHSGAVERAGGRTAAARRLVEQALSRVPASAPARFQEALLAFARGDPAAHRRAAAVLGARAGERVARVLAARTQELTGQIEEATAAWEELARQAPGDLPLLLQAAGSLARLRAPGRAAPVLARAALLDPTAPRARRGLTDFWEGPGPLAAAARDLEGIAAEEPVAGLALSGAATCELLLGRTQPAEALARRATAAAPHLARPHLVAAQAFLDRGLPAAAAEKVAAALEADPADPVAMEMRARALEAAGRYPDAAAWRARALRARPTLATARRGEARRLLREGQRERAVALLRELLAEDPDDALARGALLEAEAGGRGR